MTQERLQTQRVTGKIERPDTVLVTPSGPNHSDPEKEDRPMADYGQYTDSAQADNPEQFGNWKSIGDLARKIVEGK